MRLNDVPDHLIPRDRTTIPLNNDMLYQPFREFWALPPVLEALDAACLRTADAMRRNDHGYTHFVRTNPETSDEEESYCRVEESWAALPEPVECDIRMRLRRDKVEDKVRQTGLIALFLVYLREEFDNLQAAEPFLALEWDASDWAELLNASTWKMLDELLGAGEAPTSDGVVSARRLASVYGYALKGPGVTNLAKKVVLRFSRLGLMTIRVSGNSYQMKIGPAYRTFYRTIYAPLADEFTNKLKETQDETKDSPVDAVCRSGGGSGAYVPNQRCLNRPW